MTEAYWHTRKRLWSLREGGRVVGHVPRVCLHVVSLAVSVPAVMRVRLRGQREVCAVARGIRGDGARGGVGERVMFDPYRHTAFVTDAGVEVSGCRILFLEPDGTAWGFGWR